MIGFNCWVWRNRFSVVSALAFAVALAVAQPVLADTAKLPLIAPDAREFHLDNGLDLVVIPDHRAPIVTHMVWYRVGAADDPAGKSGIAHFLEHLMFKGTKNHPIGQFSGKISEFGGNENAFTGEDATAFFQTIAKEKLASVMDYEADRMEGLVLTDAVILPERDVILEERRMRIDNQPSALLGEAMEATLYQNHHYGIPTIGWAHEMAGLTRADAVAQYEKYYTPNNALVVVAGDVDPDAVHALAEQYYGKLPRRSDPGPRIRPTEPLPIASRSLSMSDARAAQPLWSRRYLVPSYNSAKRGEAEALQVLSDILGGGSTSRLYRSLVVDKPIANAAGAYFLGDGLDYGRFGVYGAPRDKVSPAEFEAAVDAVIADIRDHGVTQSELERSKSRTRAASIYAQDNQAALARIVGTSMISGTSLADIQNWPNRIEAVTVADVDAAARKYLDARRSVTGTLLPAASENRS